VDKLRRDVEAMAAEKARHVEYKSAVEASLVGAAASRGAANL
jgi:hypothetical protein